MAIGISEADWTSGSAYFILGWLFQSSGYQLTGTDIGPPDPKTTWDIYYADWCGGHYNVAIVVHNYGTYDYLQARTVVN